MGTLGICIDQNSKAPAYRQLYHALRSLIENGVIAPDMHMPPIRKLAAELGLARSTVETAYRQLKTEGYITSRQGSGFVVEDLDFSVLSGGDATSEIHSSELTGRDPLGDSFGCTHDFSYGNRSSDGFPTAIWRSIADEVLKGARVRGANTYIDPFGLPKLREQLATWLAQTRGCRCTPEQIVIQPGTQPALRNVMLMLGERGDEVAFEEPGYDGARLAFESQGAQLAPIPVYAGATAYVNALHACNARVAFATPSNQFPLGTTMQMGVRLRLLDWAVRRNAYIIEDDYCCEYRYGGVEPLPSLQSLDAHGRVIYMGTMSKALSPALRISYLILPPELVRRWNEVFPRDFCSVPWIEQEILARFMASDQWRPYIRRTVALYQGRHDLLASSLAKEFGSRLSVRDAQAGLHMLVSTNDGRSADELIALACEHDVRVYSTHGYWMNPDKKLSEYLLVGFSAIPEQLIEPGVHALAQAWLR